MSRHTLKQVIAMRKAMPLLVARIDREGGILPWQDVSIPFGDHLVQQAIDDGVIKLIIVNRRCLLNKQPDVKIRAVHTLQWNGEKPAWLI